MQQKDNVKCWSDYWASMLEDTAHMTSDSQVSFWNKRSGSYSASIDNDASWTETVERVLGLLDEAGFEAQGSAVLDIGCGPGPLALPLSRAGAQVTALDISSGMLRQLQEKSAKEALPVRTIECSWWDADIDALGFRNSFDLVISSMTPAVKDLNGFRKMMTCSKKLCFYSGFLKMGCNNAYREIYRTILRSDHDSHESAMSHMFMIYPFMYLYTLGYRPLVRLDHSFWKEEDDPLAVAERTIDLIGRNHALSGNKKEEIRAYFKNASNNDTFCSESEVYTGMMVWTVMADERK